jgi:cytochrome P450
MSTDMSISTKGKARNFPFYRTFPRLIRDPLKEIEQIGKMSGGDLVRVDFGVFRAYVAIHPDHVQQVLRDDSSNFRRDGTFWRPLHRLFGDSILGEGPEWELSRKILQPTLTSRHIRSMADRMADTINAAIGALDGPAQTGQPVEAAPAMTAIVHRTVLQIFFGNKISQEESDRLAPAFESIATAIAFRFLLPFLPEAVPLPGDRAYRQGVQTFDEILFPLVRRYRAQCDDDLDFFSVLGRAHEADGGEVTDQWVRNNLVSLFATGTETTAGALTWLWPLLDTHPEVAGRLYEEIDRVVGGGPVQPSYLADLTYTRQVVQELLRLYPVGWLFPRTAAAPTTLGGVSIKAGDTILLSPYLTHRLDTFWDKPLDFDPDRFSADRAASGRRHRYSYFPFGGGPHQCIGMHVFNMEAELIIAGILSRFRPVSCTPVAARPRIGATLRPRHNVEVVFAPTTGRA